MKHFITSFYYKPTLDKLKKLYKYNFDFNKTYSYLSGQSLLHAKQSYETMKYMLDRGGNPNINCTMYGLKPIHFQKEYKVIKLLIDRRAIPNPVDFNNFNPLFWQKDPESMKYLLNHNKIYNISSVSGNGFDLLFNKIYDILNVEIQEEDPNVSRERHKNILVETLKYLESSKILKNYDI